MKKFAIVLVLSSLLFSVGAYAQLKVIANGNMGIDTDSPASRFSIGGVGFANSKAYIFNPTISSSQKSLEVSQALTSDGWSYATISSVVSGTSGAKVVGVRGSANKSAVTTSGRSF